MKRSKRKKLKAPIKEILKTWKEQLNQYIFGSKYRQRISGQIADM